MAACAQQAFYGSCYGKGGVWGGGGKYISIKICMFIAAAVIYFYFLSLFIYLFSAAFQSLLEVGGTRGEPPRPRVFTFGAAAASGVVNTECIELKVTGCERGCAPAKQLLYATACRTIKRKWHVPQLNVKKEKRKKV